MIKRVLLKTLRWPLIRNLINVSQKFQPYGFEGLTFYEVFAFFIRGVFKGGIQTRASAMSFSFFLAVFPSIIFLFTLIPYIPIEGFQYELLSVIGELLPENMFHSLNDAIQEITARPSGGLLSFGFIAALFFSKNGLVAMMIGFNSSIHVKENRPEWKQQLIATGLVVVLMIVVIAGLALMIGTEYALQKMFAREGLEAFLLVFGKWVILGLLFLTIIGVFYRFGPARKRHRRFFSPGVVMASVLTITTSVIFSWYVNNFGTYNTVYGSLGTIMVVLLWIYLNSTMLLVGFELDAGIYSAREKRRSLLEQEAVEEAVAKAAEAEKEKAVREA